MGSCAGYFVKQLIWFVVIDSTNIWILNRYSNIWTDFRISKIFLLLQYADYMGTCVEAKDTLTFEFGSDDTQLNSMVVTLVESSYGIQVFCFLLHFFCSTRNLPQLYVFYILFQYSIEWICLRAKHFSLCCFCPLFRFTIIMFC